MKLNGHRSFFAELWSMLQKQGIPTPPSITSDRIKALLSRALLDPEKLTATEVQEVAASVVFHLVSLREAQDDGVNAPLDQYD